MLPTVLYTCVADSLHMANDRKPTAKILSHVRRSLVAQQCYASSSTLYPEWIPLRPQSEKQDIRPPQWKTMIDARTSFGLGYQPSKPVLTNERHGWATHFSTLRIFLLCELSDSSRHLPMRQSIMNWPVLANVDLLLMTSSISRRFIILHPHRE